MVKRLNKTPCPNCDFTVKWTSDIKRHMDACLGSNEGLFACPYADEGCKFSTRQKSNLKSHIGVHTGVKAFPCHICDFSSADAGSRTRHEKRKHGYCHRLEQQRLRLSQAVQLEKERFFCRRKRSRSASKSTSSVASSSRSSSYSASSAASSPSFISPSPSTSSASSPAFYSSPSPSTYPSPEVDPQYFEIAFPAFNDQIEPTNYDRIEPINYEEKSDIPNAQPQEACPSEHIVGSWDGERREGSQLAAYLELPQVQVYQNQILLPEYIEALMASEPELGSSNFGTWTPTPTAPISPPPIYSLPPAHPTSPESFSHSQQWDLPETYTPPEQWSFNAETLAALEPLVSKNLESAPSNFEQPDFTQAPTSFDPTFLAPQVETFGQWYPEQTHEPFWCPEPTYQPQEPVWDFTNFDFSNPQLAADFKGDMMLHAN